MWEGKIDERTPFHGYRLETRDSLDGVLRVVVKKNVYIVFRLLSSMFSSRLSSFVSRLSSNMKWVLAVFGKAGSPFIADEVDKYVKRLRGGVYPLEVVELKESKIDDRVQALAQEAALFDKKFPKSEYKRVILSEEGKLMATDNLSDTLRDRFPGNIVFLIGSAYGIDENLKKTADLLLSLSPLTFTHDHARVLFAEQLYRVQMVMQNHPYHHR